MARHKMTGCQFQNQLTIEVRVERKVEAFDGFVGLEVGASNALRQRLTQADHLSAGWWYPECA